MLLPAMHAGRHRRRPCCRHLRWHCASARIAISPLPRRLVCLCSTYALCNFDRDVDVMKLWRAGAVIGPRKLPNLRTCAPLPPPTGGDSNVDSAADRNTRSNRNLHHNSTQHSTFNTQQWPTLSVMTRQMPLRPVPPPNSEPRTRPAPPHPPPPHPRQAPS